MKTYLVVLCVLSLNQLLFAQDIPIRDHSVPVVVDENYEIYVLPYTCGTIMLVELNNPNVGNVIVELFSFSGNFLKKGIIYRGSQYTYFNLSELDSDEYLIRIQTLTAIRFSRVKLLK